VGIKFHMVVLRGSARVRPLNGSGWLKRQFLDFLFQYLITVEDSGSGYYQPQIGHCMGCQFVPVLMALNGSSEDSGSGYYQPQIGHCMGCQFVPVLMALNGSSAALTEYSILCIASSATWSLNVNEERPIDMSDKKVAPYL